MTSDSKIYTLEEFEENDNIEFSRTKLNVLYKAFFSNECQRISFHNDHCVPDDIYETIKEQYGELYKKFERNVKLIQEQPYIFSEWEEDKKNLCFYLKYWIYDQLISKNISDEEFSKFITLWNERKAAKCPSCECEFKMFSFYDVKHLKKAFDYFLFLDAYKDTTTINTHIADKNYCEYIKDAKVVYSSYLSDCGGPINKKCEEFMKYIAPYKKTDGNSSIICNIVSSHNPGQEEDSQVVKGPGHKLHLDRIEEGGPVVQVARTMATTETEQKTAGSKLGPPQEKEPESMLKSGTAKELPPPGPNLDVQKEDYGAHGYLSSGLHEVEGDRVNSHLGTSSEGNGSHIKTITSASMVGVPSIIFLLYKFTPIRTWIDPRIRKTKNVLRKGVNESNELQSNDYNFDHADMDINRYNIAYQSR